MNRRAALVQQLPCCVFLLPYIDGPEALRNLYNLHYTLNITYFFVFNKRT
jgi:hypothetical protein